MIILGIDPGTATTGFGLLKEKTKSVFECLEYGCINTSPQTPGPERLKEINQELNKIIKKHKPDLAAVENVFFFKNLKTAMPVSQAKGVILFTLAKQKIPIFEFTPLQVKMTVTGYGKAEKKQMQKMVFKIFPELEKLHPVSSKKAHLDNAVDAIAIAYCCANSFKFNSKK